MQRVRDRRRTGRVPPAPPSVVAVGGRALEGSVLAVCYETGTPPEGRRNPPLEGGLLESLCQVPLALPYSYSNTGMSSVILEAVRSVVPDPLLWAAAGAASCCGGLATGLYFVNPMAFEILMAEDDDEDAINNAIGTSVLEKFNLVLLLSALANGGASAYGVDTPVNIGCCAATLIGMGCLTAHSKLQDMQQVASDMAQTKDLAKQQHVD